MSNAKWLKNVIFAGLFLVPFIPFLVSSSFFFPFITTKVFAWRIIIEIVFAAWLLLTLADPDYRPKKSYILYALGLLILVTGVSDLFGVAPLKSLWSNFERMDGYISLLHLGMFFLVITSVFKESNWKHWWNTSLVASFLMVLYCFLQILGLKTINQGGVRVDGTFGNAIYLAVYMLFHIFIALLFLWREWRNVALRWVYGLLILAQGTILYFTATRGAILGLIGGLFVLAILNVRNRESLVVKKASIALLSLLVIVIGGFLLIKDSALVQNSPVLSRFASLNTEEIKTQGRYFVWPMAIEGWKDRPIFGWGQENFTYIFQEHYLPNMFHLEPWFDRAHNIFLDWLVAGGLLGLAAYLALYLSLLYILWWKSPNFSYADKSIITGLVAAYFFHNFFVFDHLVSYILFFSLLAYIHHLSDGKLLWEEILPKRANIVAVIVIILLVLPALYFVNIKPLKINLTLIEALKATQVSGDMQSAIVSFKQASKNSYLGRLEVVEQMTANSPVILSSDITMEEKNDFFSFIMQRLAEQSEYPHIEQDARYQLMAGSLLSTTGLMDEALARLNRAKELIPGKQQVYFEIGAVYINKNKPLEALEIFKEAYELAPEYIESKSIYLIGAIYAKDLKLENTLLGEIGEKNVVFDDRVIDAYYKNGRISKVRELLNLRIKLDPGNAARYQEYLKELAN